MSDKFFRFPLRVLSGFASPLERLENVIGYCVMDVGQRVLSETGQSGATKDEHRSLVWKIGCNVLSVTSSGKGADKRLQDEHDAVVWHCGEAAQATVSIRADWLWNCLYGLRNDEDKPEMPLSYREFSVLCAILSKLGDKDLESCTWQEIQRRALGYTTEAQMKERLPYRRDGAKPLTRQQIRSTLNDLERCGFFARYAVGNGEKCFLTYFSFKMPKQELKAKAYTAFTKRRRRGPIRRTQGDKDEAARLWANRYKQA